LKLVRHRQQGAVGGVAPRTGAWIETPLPMTRTSATSRRPPHGGVD